jgi:two-component system KDP operon response regulator KdpE
LEANAYRGAHGDERKEGLVSGAAQHRPAVIILDLGLPDLSGQEVLRRLREWSTRAGGSSFPSRMIEAGKVAALDAGRR